MSIPPLTITAVPDGGRATVVSLVVAGELDLSTTFALDEAIADVLEQPERTVVLDLTAVGFADSSALSSLLRGHRRYGDRLRVGACSGPVTRLFEVAGVGQILHRSTDDLVGPAPSAT